MPVYSVPLHNDDAVCVHSLLRIKHQLHSAARQDTKGRRASPCIERGSQLGRAEQQRISTSDPTVTGRSPDSGQLDDRGLGAGVRNWRLLVVFLFVADRTLSGAEVESRNVPEAVLQTPAPDRIPGPMCARFLSSAGL